MKNNMKNILTTSVVIPYYNGGIYIIETIEHILRQTVLPNDIIIVNDGSTDQNSIDVLNDLQKTYENIIVVHQENSGVSCALNAGIKKSCRDIIFQVDCDDIIVDTYIEKLLHEFQNDQTVDGVTCGYRMFYDGDDITDATKLQYTYMPEGLSRPKIFFENCAGGANSAFRREVLEKIGYFNEEFKAFQDWGIWLKFAQYDLKQVVVPEYLYLYRRHDNSFSQSTDIIAHMDEKLCRYKGMIEHGDVDHYSLAEYKEQKKEFYKDSCVKNNKRQLLKTLFNGKKLHGLWKEFCFAVKRDGPRIAMKRAWNFIKNGSGFAV